MAKKPLFSKTNLTSPVNKKFANVTKGKQPKPSPGGKVGKMARRSFKIVPNEGSWTCWEFQRNGSSDDHFTLHSESEIEAHIEDHRRMGDTVTRAFKVAGRMAKIEMSEQSSSSWVRNVRPDTLDFRDKMYESGLLEVPISISLNSYSRLKVPVLNQGQTNSCTGFALATVANYLLRKRRQTPSKIEVSASMFYCLARRYDEFPGQSDTGSSCRGAMKGWQKHGICSKSLWKLDSEDNLLTEKRMKDALQRPLGSYYRVNHKDLIAMHCAIAEVGILYASAVTHHGWDPVNKDGIIQNSPRKNGGHAFAIVAYDSRGFWIQNSWGSAWGKNGFGLITYDDWLENGMDVWVARLGAPVLFERYQSASKSFLTTDNKSSGYSYAYLRPHIISIGNEGQFKDGGEIGTSKLEVESIFDNDFPQITKKWKKKRLLIYAHGGLVSEKAAVQRLADYRSTLLENEVYPISIIWHTDSWSTITNILTDGLKKRKSEGFIDSAMDFMLDRLDDTLEPIARQFTGKLQWSEIKENALRATQLKFGALRFTLQKVKELAKQFGSNFEIHLIGHSAGSVLLGPMVELLTGKISDSGLGLKIKTTTLWAPACTIDFFNEKYLPSIINRSIEDMAVFNLTDQAEQDDHCAHIYHKSLLYLVSNAFEGNNTMKRHKYLTPILGLERCIQDDPNLSDLFRKENLTRLILAPNNNPMGSTDSSTCTSHGGFDDDEATVVSALKRILNEEPLRGKFIFGRSESSAKDQRKFLNS